MIERVVENWLDRANERTFQIPFCHALSAQGQTVLHLSRHCGMELGKDIIAVDSSGRPFTYQLKGLQGGKLTLSRWRDEVSKQIYDLALCRVVHPAINSNKVHKPVLVINGELEEEVSRAIDDFNRQHPRNRIQVIVKGQLLEMLLELKSDFWPTTDRATKSILELLLMSGCERFPKGKLAQLLELVLPLSHTKTPTKESCSRAIASAAVLCSLVTSAFSARDNHLAEVEAWTIFGSYTLALAEKCRLPTAFWQPEFDLALVTIRNALARLAEELQERPHLVEGDALTDHMVYRIRLTHLVGLMALHSLWGNWDRWKPGKPWEQQFCERHQDEMILWGEAAVPQFLALYFFLSATSAGHRSERIMLVLLNTITRCNRPEGQNAQFAPYYDVDDCLPHLVGLSEKPLGDTFAGSSHTIEALLHLAVRDGWKQRIKALWPEVSRIDRASFAPDRPWQYYLWRSSKGTDWTRQWQRTQSWPELRSLARDGSGAGIPRLMKSYPVFYLCFLTVFPHRLNASGIRWLAGELDRLL